MREVEALYLFLLGLYLVETLLTVPLGAVVVARGGRRWRLRKPLVLRGGAGPAVVFPYPLPPLGLVMVGSGAGRLALVDAREGVASFERASWELRVAESLLFVALFGGGALLVWWGGAPDVPILMAMAWAWSLTIVYAFVTRARLPLAQRPGWGALSVALLSPISSVRLHDILGKEVASELDGRALAVALLPPDAAAESMRRALARARVEGSSELAALTALALDAGLDPDALRAAPEPESAQAVAWCPICRDQFVRAEEPCLSCGGVALERFER